MYGIVRATQRMPAETNRGKAAGLYIDRKIIKTGKLDDMSLEELEARMKKIEDDYSQITLMIASSCW